MNIPLYEQRLREAEASIQNILNAIQQGILTKSTKSHRKMLIDTFVNAIYLYDDKMLLTFNFKEGTKTITFDDVNDAQSKYGNGSDLDWRTAPVDYFVIYKRSIRKGASLFLCPNFNPHLTLI